MPAPASLPAPSAPSAPAAPLVDVRAARLAQAFVAVTVAASALLGAWGLLAVPALHLLLAAALGRRGNLVVRGFDAYLRPRLGGGAVEDARPPRFASAIGAIFLAASLFAHAAGAATLGWSLALAVAALAGLAAATGLCIGCRMYWLVALVRRARAGARSA
jgi:hypothetical protein